MATQTKYRAGLDANGQWEASMGDLALKQSGAIVDVGQVPAWMKKWLREQVKAGLLVEYKGYWNTLSTFTGMGPLKTIWAKPSIAAAHGGHFAKVA
jgi:hypothetical protein